MLIIHYSEAVSSDIKICASEHLRLLRQAEPRQGDWLRRAVDGKLLAARTFTAVVVVELNSIFAGGET